MKPMDLSNQHTFRLVIVRRDGSEILFTSGESGWTLPCVQVSLRERLAQQLTAQWNGRSGLRAYCLFIPSCVEPDENTRLANYAVMESFNQNDDAPRGMRWMSRTAFVCEPARDRDAIEKSLCELDSYVSQPKGGIFGRPGWLGEVLDWTQEQLDPLGLDVNGRFRQLNASPTFSLVRLETNGPAVWFKATGKPNLHELPITISLSRLFAANLAPILGVHPSWNAWLSEEVSNTTLEEFKEPSIWERVSKNLAELQIASIGKSGTLLDAQCRDLRLPRLLGLVAPFLARMAEYMAVQEKQFPPPLTTRELDFLGERLREALSVLQELGVPDTLGHLDLNPGNILVSPARCVFLDWAEACVTNPFITFEYLAEYGQHADIAGPDGGERAAHAYRGPWRSLLSPDRLARAAEVSPLAAVFVYAVAANAWCSPDTLHDVSDAAFLRGLTRRMHREAIRLAERSVRCSA
jgi:hypothetical protein